MTCLDELGAVQSQIAALAAEQTRLSNTIASYRALIAAATPSVVGQAATATTTGPATRPTTQPQAEQRGVGSGEMAQYAALARDIADMEARLDRLEAR